MVRKTETCENCEETFDYDAPPEPTQAVYPSYCSDGCRRMAVSR